MEKVSDSHLMGFCACGCAMPFSAHALFVTAPARLGVNADLSVRYDSAREFDAAAQGLRPRFQRGFLGGAFA
jgi:hypothetical protein